MLCSAAIDRLYLHEASIETLFVQDGATAEALQAICSPSTTVFGQHAAAANLSMSCHLAGGLRKIQIDGT